MNIKMRKETVLAMETLVWSVNNEDLLDSWLMYGVAEGDIKENSTWEDVEDYYIEDKIFAELMRLFLKIMSKAYVDGGLYIDKIVSED